MMRQEEKNKNKQAKIKGTQTMTLSDSQKLVNETHFHSESGSPYLCIFKSH